jgi:hypothetical protein
MTFAVQCDKHSGAIMLEGTFVPSMCSPDSRMGLHAECFYQKGEGEPVEVSGIASPVESKSGTAFLADHMMGEVQFKTNKLLAPIRKRL